MAINMKQEERKNRYVWRLDFSLPGEDNYNSEIGREIKKNSGPIDRKHINRASGGYDISNTLS